MDLIPVRDFILAVDIVLGLWFFKLGWYRLSSVTATCVVVSLMI